MLARTDWPIPFGPDWEEPQDFYWTPPQRAETDEVHAKVLQAVSNRSGVKLYTANLHEAVLGAPVGYIDLALDHRAEQACGIYLRCSGVTEADVSPAVWLPIKPTLDDTMGSFVEELRRRGWL